MYKEIVDGTADASLRAPEQNNILDAQQRDEDECGAHRLHVGSGFSAVGLLQLRDQDTDDVQEEEEVHLCRTELNNIIQPYLHLSVFCHMTVPGTGLRVDVYRHQKQNSALRWPQRINRISWILTRA